MGVNLTIDDPSVTIDSVLIVIDTSYVEVAPLVVKDRRSQPFAATPNRSEPFVATARKGSRFMGRSAGAARGGP